MQDARSMSPPPCDSAVEVTGSTPHARDGDPFQSDQLAPSGVGRSMRAEPPHCARAAIPDVVLKWGGGGRDGARLAHSNEEARTNKIFQSKTVLKKRQNWRSETKFLRGGGSPALLESNRAHSFRHSFVQIQLSRFLCVWSFVFVRSPRVDLCLNI